MSRGKINIITLGCSKNTVDSEKLLIQLKAGGFETVYDPDDFTSQRVIINTCGFINDAREESIDTILRFIKAKEEGKIEKLYVMGCLSQRYMNELKTEIPEVDRYFGVKNIPDILNEMGINFKEELSEKRILSGPAHYAYLKVSEGCDRACSFCAIPAIRGRTVSRPFEEILKEADNLAEMGVKELILVAQDLSYYGIDLYKKQMLPRLVEKLLLNESFDWIRLHYLYPANFPAELITLIKQNPRICRYIDIPLQHITDRMLGLMRRSHNRNETENLLEQLRSELPESAIRTTLITGHPGETEEDFLELKKFVQSFRFDRLGVFAYSHEEGTYSYKKYNDDVPDDVKMSRAEELMLIQQDISSVLNNKFIDKTIKVIIDRREGDYFIGRSEYDSPEVDQEVLISAEHDLKPGNFYNILITESSEFDLFGKPLSPV